MMQRRAAVKKNLNRTLSFLLSLLMAFSPATLPGARADGITAPIPGTGTTLPQGATTPQNASDQIQNQTSPSSENPPQAAGEEFSQNEGGISVATAEAESEDEEFPEVTNDSLTPEEIAEQERQAQEQAQRTARERSIAEYLGELQTTSAITASQDRAGNPTLHVQAPSIGANSFDFTFDDQNRISKVYRNLFNTIGPTQSQEVVLSYGQNGQNTAAITHRVQADPVDAVMEYSGTVTESQINFFFRLSAGRIRAAVNRHQAIVFATTPLRVIHRRSDPENIFRVEKPSAQPPVVLTVTLDITVLPLDAISPSSSWRYDRVTASEPLNAVDPVEAERASQREQAVRDYLTGATIQSALLQRIDAQNRKTVNTTVTSDGTFSFLEVVFDQNNRMITANHRATENGAVTQRIDFHYYGDVLEYISTLDTSIATDPRQGHLEITGAPRDADIVSFIKTASGRVTTAWQRFYGGTTSAGSFIRKRASDPADQYHVIFQSPQHISLEVHLRDGSGIDPATGLRRTDDIVARIDVGPYYAAFETAALDFHFGTVNQSSSFEMLNRQDGAVLLSGAGPFGTSSQGVREKLQKVIASLATIRSFFSSSIQPTDSLSIDAAADFIQLIQPDSNPSRLRAHTLTLNAAGTAVTAHELTIRNSSSPFNALETHRYEFSSPGRFTYRFSAGTPRASDPVITFDYSAPDYPRPTANLVSLADDTHRFFQGAIPAGSSILLGGNSSIFQDFPPPFITVTHADHTATILDFSRMENGQPILSSVRKQTADFRYREFFIVSENGSIVIQNHEHITLLEVPAGTAVTAALIDQAAALADPEQRRAQARRQNILSYLSSLITDLNQDGRIDDLDSLIFMESITAGQTPDGQQTLHVSAQSVGARSFDFIFDDQNRILKLYRNLFDSVNPRESQVVDFTYGDNGVHTAVITHRGNGNPSDGMLEFSGSLTENQVSAFNRLTASRVLGAVVRFKTLDAATTPLTFIKRLNEAENLFHVQENSGQPPIEITVQLDTTLPLDFFVSHSRDRATAFDVRGIETYHAGTLNVHADIKAGTFVLTDSEGTTLAQGELREPVFDVLYGLREHVSRAVQTITAGVLFHEAGSALQPEDVIRVTGSRFDIDRSVSNDSGAVVTQHLLLRINAGGNPAEYLTITPQTGGVAIRTFIFNADGRLRVTGRNPGSNEVIELLNAVFSADSSTHPEINLTHAAEALIRFYGGHFPAGCAVTISSENALGLEFLTALIRTDHAEETLRFSAVPDLQINDYTRLVDGQPRVVATFYEENNQGMIRVQKQNGSFLETLLEAAYAGAPTQQAVQVLLAGAALYNDVLPLGASVTLTFEGNSYHMRVTAEGETAHFYFGIDEDGQAFLKFKLAPGTVLTPENQARLLQIAETGRRIAEDRMTAGVVPIVSENEFSIITEGESPTTYRLFFNTDVQPVDSILFVDDHVFYSLIRDLEEDNIFRAAYTGAANTNPIAAIQTAIEFFGEELHSELADVRMAQDSFGVFSVSLNMPTRDIYNDAPAGRKILEINPQGAILSYTVTIAEGEINEAASYAFKPDGALAVSYAEFQLAFGHFQLPGELVSDVSNLIRALDTLGAAYKGFVPSSAEAPAHIRLIEDGFIFEVPVSTTAHDALKVVEIEGSYRITEVVRTKNGAVTHRVAIEDDARASLFLGNAADPVFTGSLNGPFAHPVFQAMLSLPEFYGQFPANRTVEISYIDYFGGVYIDVVGDGIRESFAYSSPITFALDPIAIDFNHYTRVAGSDTLEVSFYTEPDQAGHVQNRVSLTTIVEGAYVPLINAAYQGAETLHAIESLRVGSDYFGAQSEGYAFTLQLGEDGSLSLLAVKGTENTRLHFELDAAGHTRLARVDITKPGYSRSFGISANRVQVKGENQQLLLDATLPASTTITPALLAVLDKIAPLHAGASATLTAITTSEGTTTLQISAPIAYTIAFNISPVGLRLRDITLHGATFTLPVDQTLSANLLLALNATAPLQSGNVNIATVTATASLFSLQVAPPAAYTIAFNVSSGALTTFKNIIFPRAPGTVTLTLPAGIPSASTPFSPALLLAMKQAVTIQSSAITVSEITSGNGALTLKFTSGTYTYHVMIRTSGAVPVLQRIFKVNGRNVRMLDSSLQIQSTATVPTNTVLSNTLLAALDQTSPFHAGSSMTISSVTTSAGTIQLNISTAPAYAIVFNIKDNGLEFRDITLRGAKFTLPADTTFSMNLLKALDRIAPLQEGNVTIAAITTSTGLLTLQVSAPAAYTSVFTVSSTGVTLRDITLRDTTFTLPANATFSVKLFTALDKTSSFYQGGTVNITAIATSSSEFKLTTRSAISGTTNFRTLDLVYNSSVSRLLRIVRAATTTPVAPYRRIETVLNNSSAIKVFNSASATTPSQQRSDAPNPLTLAYLLNNSIL